MKGTSLPGWDSSSCAGGTDPDAMCKPRASTAGLARPRRRFHPLTIHHGVCTIISAKAHTARGSGVNDGVVQALLGWKEKDHGKREIAVRNTGRVGALQRRAGGECRGSGSSGRASPPAGGDRGRGSGNCPAAGGAQGQQAGGFQEGQGVDGERSAGGVRHAQLPPTELRHRVGETGGVRPATLPRTQSPDAEDPAAPRSDHHTAPGPGGQPSRSRRHAPAVAQPSEPTVPGERAEQRAPLFLAWVQEYGGPANFTAPRQTLRWLVKLYGASPNLTPVQRTLRRPSKRYAAPPNLTLARRTLRSAAESLRRPSKLYAGPPNLTALRRTLRGPAKPYVGPSNFTAAQQTLRRTTKQYAGSPNRTSTQKTLRRAAKRYSASPNLTPAQQTPRRHAKLYAGPENFTARRQTLRRPGEPVTRMPCAGPLRVLDFL